MILVVYFHLAAYSFGSYELGYNDIIERFRMPTFFFISGWLLYKTGRIWDRQAITGMIRKKFMVQIIPTTIFMFLYLRLRLTSEPRLRLLQVSWELSLQREQERVLPPEVPVQLPQLLLQLLLPVRVRELIQAYT